MIKKTVRRIRNEVWKWHRKRFNEKNKSRLTAKGEHTSIISVNCTGGILSHDLGLQFLSPTINLFMRAEDFMRFCENLNYYLSIEHFVECKDPSIRENRTYPIAFLDDITLFLVHYHSVAEAEQKWNERKKRINWNNIVIINTDREGMNEALKDRFEKLPYIKVMFTHLPDERHPSCFYLPGYENEQCVGIITEPYGWRGYRPVDKYDWVSLLNGEIGG